MARTVQTARCSHSGPPCHDCVRQNLLRKVMQELLASGRNWHTDVDDAEKKELNEMIEVKVAASIMANGDKKNLFGRRVIDVLSEVHRVVEQAYTIELNRPGIDKSTARTNALNVVGNHLGVIFDRYDRQQAINNRPDQIMRRERAARREEIRNATHYIRSIEGGPAASANAELQGALAGVHEALIRETVLSICTRIEYQGVSMQLIVSHPNDHTVFYRVFSKSPDGLEITYGTGSCSSPDRLS